MQQPTNIFKESKHKTRCPQEISWVNIPPNTWNKPRKKMSFGPGNHESHPGEKWKATERLDESGQGLAPGERTLMLGGRRNVIEICVTIFGIWKFLNTELKLNKCQNYGYRIECKSYKHWHSKNSSWESGRREEVPKAVQSANFFIFIARSHSILSKMEASSYKTHKRVPIS